jgi:1-pyrroline-5-carboxylate dehydrogenase
MLHAMGMPSADADYVHGHGSVVNQILLQGRPRSTLFTGSKRVAEKLCADLHGKVLPV